MTRTLLLVALCALAGCAATKDSVKRSTARLQGKPVSVLLAKWGTPAHTSRVGEVTKQVRDESACPVIHYGFGLPDSRSARCLSAAPLKTVVVTAGTGETKYTWRNEAHHDASSYTPLVTNQFDGWIGKQPVYGTVTTLGTPIDSAAWTVMCAVTVTTDSAGVIKATEVSTDEPGVCQVDA